MIIDFIITFFLFKDPDGEKDGVIMDSMDADQSDLGEGKESDQPSNGKDDGMIKVRYQI